MWVAHYASGLIAKPFAPRVPLSLLALAGAFPDVVFFLLQFFGIETFNLDSSLISHGCFPYSNDYPYSHSLLGMTLSGERICGLSILGMEAHSSTTQVSSWPSCTNRAPPPL